MKVCLCLDFDWDCTESIDLMGEKGIFERCFLQTDNSEITASFGFLKVLQCFKDVTPLS
jgi:hypothetical protein